MARQDDANAELNAAYEPLAEIVKLLLATGHDGRAVLGALGRLYIQLSRENLDQEERVQLATVILRQLEK